MVGQGAIGVVVVVVIVSGGTGAGVYNIRSRAYDMLGGGEDD